MDTPTWIAKAIAKWGEGRFGYDRCGPWKGSKVPIEIYCCVCSEYFLQAPDKHLQGIGCRKCHYEAVSLNNPFRRSVAQFIEDARKIHGDKYDYSRVENPVSENRIEIGCPKHGWFTQQVAIHLRGNGCNDCGNESSSLKQSMTTEQCLERFREVHDDKYEYPDFEYKGWESKILALCRVHGPWETTTAGSHIGGCGCPDCGILQRAEKWKSNTEEFITKAQLLTGYKEKYDYSKVEYEKALKKVSIRCVPHDYWFEQTPNKHLSGEEGCHKCQKNGCSKKQVEWLAHVEETTEGGPIQHKLNGGEFRIPGTRYHADGWRPAINTVYEFHGTLWHGHPNHPDFVEDRPHPIVKNKTWGQVFMKTIEKEKRIRELGYRLVVMWEHDLKPKPLIP
jgi:hypothetical protein